MQGSAGKNPPISHDLEFGTRPSIQIDKEYRLSLVQDMIDLSALHGEQEDVSVLLCVVSSFCFGLVQPSASGQDKVW